MNTLLYNWLLNEWKACNLPKYQKYFKQWVNNLTNNQIQGFEKAFNSDYINNNLCTKE